MGNTIYIGDAELSKVNPTFTVTCQCATLLFSRLPRTSATSNQLILRIVLPARLIALFTASWNTIRRGTDQLDLFVDVVTHERIKIRPYGFGRAHIPNQKSRSDRPFVAMCSTGLLHPRRSDADQRAFQD